MTPKANIEFSYRDYPGLPDWETNHDELLEGELIMVPSPITHHQRFGSQTL